MLNTQSSARKNESDASELDEMLIILVREGDPAAMAELWRRHFRVACEAARRVSGCSDPSDAASEAFLQTVRAIRAGRGPVTGSFRSYVCSVAGRLAVRDAVRRSALEPVLLRVETSLPEDVASTVQEIDSTVITGWEQLPDRWRHVLWLTVVEGRTPADVAEQVGMTANAVATLAYRARCRLRVLNGEGDVELASTAV
jgi:RNA polymerase sigma factor (sigma-70 family)